ncbi:hypothetical protein BUALT_Bualt03G0070600 [Buddleja alternifolia]|uniref:Uncharacterized protein n=1 Tax=Buddleja alternifolia TaxID=168488 RepID=A0AAV6XT85_9LAMI|nr:hypothetical protein BUALT_Bualt03G0070600 [Buddleja alternifolia]
MSKKKATMTLKDFHGGSIPSDLPLPSAPGVTASPADRGSFDRQMSWGSSMGRSEPRLRPASAGSARTLDDKAPFLSQSPYIGRNFDEDERKPLDGVSGPRRTVCDDTFRAQSPRIVEPKIDNLSGSRVGSRGVSVSVSQISSGPSGSSYAGRLSEAPNAGLNNQSFSGTRTYGSNYPNTGGNAGQAVVGSYANAWGIRKDNASMKEPVSAAWSAPDAETKLAHASALEKVSSGRWNSKHVHPQKDTEVFGLVETEGELQHKSNNIGNKNNYNRLDVVGDTEYHDVSLMMHAKRSLTVDDGIRGDRKELPTYERVKPTHPIESYLRKSSVPANGFQLVRPKSGGPEFQTTLPSESSERPKLKLLPRSKPLESSEMSLVDYNLGYQQTTDILHVEDSFVQSGFAGSVVGDQAPERPKLNLKPRSQPLEQLERKGEVRRGIVFGGARPREKMVLKGRGVEYDVSTYESQPSLRVKDDAPKVVSPMHVTLRYIEKAENIAGEQKIAKFTHRRDHQVDVDRTDPQRRSKRNEIWRNNREVEKHHNQHPQQPQDRPPSPETWRKPVEYAKPATPDGQPVRYGKAASAVELAQAFSKSVSDPTIVSGPRGLPGRGQIPFSRLTSPTPRPQINGY